jgi:hypothetical protein
LVLQMLVDIHMFAFTFSLAPQTVSTGTFSCAFSRRTDGRRVKEFSFEVWTDSLFAGLVNLLNIVSLGGFGPTRLRHFLLHLGQ